VRLLARVQDAALQEQLASAATRLGAELMMVNSPEGSAVSAGDRLLDAVRSHPDAVFVESASGEEIRTLRAETASRGIALVVACPNDQVAACAAETRADEWLLASSGDVEGTVHVPLDERSGGDDRDGRALAPAEFLAGETHRDIEGRLNLGQEVDILRDAILRLKEQERIVLTLYYYEELKLHEIATILELTESRVSQVRSKALSRLRGEMAPLREMVA